MARVHESTWEDVVGAGKCDVRNRETAMRLTERSMGVDYSNTTFDARPHRRTRTVRSYSPGCANVHPI